MFVFFTRLAITTYKKLGRNFMLTNDFKTSE